MSTRASARERCGRAREQDFLDSGPAVSRQTMLVRGLLKEGRSLKDPHPGELLTEPDLAGWKVSP